MGQIAMTRAVNEMSNTTKRRRVADSLHRSILPASTTKRRDWVALNAEVPCLIICRTARIDWSGTEYPPNGRVLRSPILDETSDDCQSDSNSLMTDSSVATNRATVDFESSLCRSALRRGVAVGESGCLVLHFCLEAGCEKPRTKSRNVNTATLSLSTSLLW